MDFELRTAPADLVPAELQERIKAEVGGMIAGTSVIEKISTPEESQNAVNLCAEIKVMAKKIEQDRTALVGPLNAKVSSINDYFRAPREALEAVEKNIKAVNIRYTEEQRRIADDAQRKADETARLERMKAEEEARKRREAEEVERRKAEEARRKAELEQDEARRAALLAEAAKADQKAEKEAAKAENAEVAAVSTVAVFSGQPPKAQGFSVSYDYRAEVEDPIALMAWCFAQEKYHLLMINEKMLNKMVSAEKEAFKAPGVKVLKIASAAVSTRGRRAA